MDLAEPAEPVEPVGSQPESVASETRRAWAEPVVWIALAALLAPLAVAAVRVLASRYFPAADVAVLELDLAHAERVIPWTGVYSRFGFRHPGPALYAWLAPFWHLWGGKGFIVAAACWNALCIGGIVVLLWRRGGVSLLAVGAVALGALEWGVLADLVSPWNPWMVLLATLLFLLLVWEAVAGSPWATVGVVGLGSMLVQFHLGLAPLVSAGVLGVAGALLILHRQRPTRQQMLWCAGVIGAMWVLPMLEQISGHPGNITKLINATTHPTEALSGATVATDVMRQAVAFPPPWLRTPAFDWAGNPIAPTLLTTAPFAALILVAGVLALRDKVVRIGLAIGLGALVVSWLASSRITGPALFYVVRWTWLPALMCWIVGLWALARAARKVLPTREAAPIAANTAAVVAVSLGLVAALTVTVARPTDSPDEVGSRLVSHVIGPVLASVDPDSALGTHLVGETLQGAGIGIVAELDRRGYDVYVPDEYQTSVGVDRVRAGREVDKVLTVSVAYVGARIGTTDRLIAEWDPLTTAQRGEAKELEELELAVLTGARPRTAMREEQSKRRRELIAAGPAIAVYLSHE